MASLVVFSQLHEVAEVDLAAGAPRHCLTFDAFCEMASGEKSRLKLKLQPVLNVIKVAMGVTMAVSCLQL